ncbi:hypothetical protein [Nannocystis pusilla]|uniref:P-loop NTPase n=1 Tax=Nannocystis pusilla TaxID=889268 RepID=UPI003B7922B5
MGALHALLIALFSGEEFRRWLRLGPYAGIVPELPGEVASHAAFVEAALGSLERRRLIDASFFARLTRERERSRDDIIAVANLWRLSGRDLETDPALQRERGVEDPVVVTPELYFRPWLEARPGHHHCWTLVGRESLCGELINTITAKQQRVMLLEGRGGIGKSRVLLELARRLREQGLPVFAYQEGGEATGERLGELPGERAVLLLDDAHRIDPDDLTRIIEFTAKQRPRLTLVFACRPYGVELITRLCSAAGLGSDTQYRCELPNLSEAARIALAAEALGHGHDPTLLARAFPDAPLFITVGGSLVRAGSLSLEQLRRSDDMRRLVFDHFPYKPLLRDRSIPDSHIHTVLGVAALLTPLSTRDRPLIEQMSGLAPATATEAVELLFHLGIMEDVNGILRILPDLYGSHATLKWAAPHGTSAGNVHALWQRLHEHRLRLTLLRNLLELMRDVASACLHAALQVELTEIWTQCVQARDAIGSIDERYNRRYLEMMASELAPQALELAERLARAPRSNAESELCVALTRPALRASAGPNDPVRIRGVNLLVHLARDAQGAATGSCCRSSRETGISQKMWAPRSSKRSCADRPRPSSSPPPSTPSRPRSTSRSTPSARGTGCRRSCRGTVSSACASSRLRCPIHRRTYPTRFGRSYGRSSSRGISGHRHAPSTSTPAVRRRSRCSTLWNAASWRPVTSAAHSRPAERCAKASERSTRRSSGRSAR